MGRKKLSPTDIFTCSGGVYCVWVRSISFFRRHLLQSSRQPSRGACLRCKDFLQGKLSMKCCGLPCFFDLQLHFVFQAQAEAGLEVQKDECQERADETLLSTSASSQDPPQVFRQPRLPPPLPAVPPVPLRRAECTGGTEVNIDLSKSNSDCNNF